jgi:hypothetical protein
MVGGKGAAEKRLAHGRRRTGLEMSYSSQPVWRGSAFPTGLDMWPSRGGDLHLSRLSFGEDCFRLCHHLGQMNRFEVEFERVQQVTCQC